MSDAVLVAFITGGMPCVAIFVKGLVDWSVSQRAARAVARVANTANATHALVNGQRSEMLEHIEQLKREVAALYKRIDTIKEG